MSSFHPRNGFIYGTLINLFIAKMLNGVMLFFWLHFGSKSSSKSHVEIPLLHPLWLKMVKEIDSSTKESNIIPKDAFYCTVDYLSANRGVYSVVLFLAELLHTLLDKFGWSLQEL